MTNNYIINDLIAKTMAELSEPESPRQRSRAWTSPTGYRHLVQWSNAILLRYFVRLYTNNLPKSEYRQKAQLDDAARSIVRNIEEGFKRATTLEYIDFVGYSQGSLEEVKGDIRDATEDGFLQTKKDSDLASIGIDLTSYHNTLAPKKDLVEDPSTANAQYLPKSFSTPDKGGKGALKEDTQNTSPNFTPLPILYPPLKKVRSEDLTYEIFIELINKTDWLLRKLVESLEQKLVEEKKYYQVEQARIRGNLK